ncbi:unnamed protein product [Protopolystoma xenopodis]|uniref:Uncharacterized protein n=1 Tax=Protopolystoma xenopodis TaxID=117903 RepID=A0A3S5CNU6_9PLAT|nr:unnamed protein product [Protopolystoma xenopodis]
MSRTLVSASEPSPQTFPPANLSAAVFGTGNVVTATQLPTSAFSISSSSNPLISESLHSIEEFDLTSRVARPTFATESSVAISIAPTSIFNMVDDVDAITPITIAVTGSIHPISAPNSHTTLTTSVSSSTVLVPGAHSKLPELTNGLHSSSVNPDIHAKSTDTFSSSSSSISPSRTQQQLKQQQNPPISSTGFCCVDDDLSTLTLDVLGSGPGLLASVCDPSSNMGLVDASIPISESSCFTPSSNILPTTRSIEGAPSDAIKSIASPPFIDSNFVAIEGGENVPLSQLQFGHSTGAVHSLPSCQVSTDLSTASFKPSMFSICYCQTLKVLSLGLIICSPASQGLTFIFVIITGALSRHLF